MSLIQNNNKKVIRRLAARSLKTYRFRTVCTLITVFLNAFIMTLVPLVNTASLENAYSGYKKEEDAAYYHADAAQLESLEKSPYFEASVRYNEASLGKTENMSSPGKLSKDVYAYPVCSRPGNASMPIYTLTSGQLPKKYHEAAADEALAQKLGLSLNDTVKFSNIDGQSADFTVTAFVKTAYNTSVPCIYVSESFAAENTLFKNTAPRLLVSLKQQYKKNSENAGELLYDIGLKAGLTEDDIVINYISFENALVGPEHILLYIVIDLCCFLVSLLVVYSISNISVMARIPEFGQMQTLGMSSGQIHRFIRSEGFYENIIGTLSGIVCAFIICYAATGYFSLKYYLLFGAAVFLLSLLFIGVCLRKPAKTASAVSPVEAAKYCVYSNVSHSHRKLTPKYLAKLHFKGEKRKSIFTIISLIIGGTLFIWAATWLYSTDSDKMARQGYYRNYEYVISYISQYQYVYDSEFVDFQKQNIMNDELIQELSKLPEVETVRARKSINISMNCGPTAIIDTFTAVTKKDYEQFASSVKIKLPSWEMLVSSNGVMMVENPWALDIADGTEAEVTYYSGHEYETRQMPVFTCTDDDFLRNNFIWSSFIVPEPVMEKMMPGINTTCNLLISAKDGKVTPQLSEKIERIVSLRDLITVESLADRKLYIVENNRLATALLFTGSFLVIIYSIINLINTMVSTMVSRNKELALLEAAGMDIKQIKKMLIWECLYLSVPALLISSILGIGLGWLLLKLLALSGVSYIVYHMPFSYFFLYAFFSLAFPVAVTLICFSRFNKKGLAERLKQQM